MPFYLFTKLFIHLLNCDILQNILITNYTIIDIITIQNILVTSYYIYNEP